MSVALESLGHSAPRFIHLVLAGDPRTRQDQEAFLYLTEECPGALALARVALQPPGPQAPRPLAVLSSGPSISASVYYLAVC